MSDDAKTKRINDTILEVYKVLKENKDNPKVKEAYEKCEELTQKRALLG